MCRTSPRARDARVSIAAAALLSACNPLDLCPPVDGRVGFFSKGDCVLTRAGFFGGHEWITYFGNRDLPAEERFTEEEIGVIVEGNRRVDFPKEMLVHLNTSVLAYTKAIIEYQDRPENQPIHFLLGMDNGHREAASDSYEQIRRRTHEAVDMWTSNRTAALTRIGQACHTIQDSFSIAHSVRDTTHPTRPWCLRKLKAYITRARGFLTSDIEFHGGRENSSIGHTTTEDSIYREGRDCAEPSTLEDVERCLSEHAESARAGTRDYLRAVFGLVTQNADAVSVDLELDRYIAAHLSFCDPA